RADRARIARHALRLGWHRGQRIRLLRARAIRVRPAWDPAAPHEPRSGTRRSGDRPSGGRAPTGRHPALLRPAGFGRDACRAVRRRMEVYPTLVTRKDSLSREIGRGLKRRGYSVRSAVKGGGAPAAYLLWFTQRETEPGAATWLYIRLADTRTGAIVAAVSAPRDSLGSTVEARARAIVDSLTRRPP